MQEDKLLALLSGHEGAYVSGQAIADALDVTRAAVWKAVESLRADGYVIGSAAAKGYRLESVPDIIGAREISLGLDTKVMGRTVYSLSEVDSTNTFASMLAARGEPEGTLVIAESQSAGRGRLGRRWVSPAGSNIYMSLVLRPGFAPSDAPLTTLAASVALVRAVRGLYGLDASIKWPNDMLISGRKAAGILTEMSAEPDSVRHVVVGTGVDVNMNKGQFPREIRDVSTSIMLETGKKTNRAALVRRILSEFEGVYGLLVAGSRAELLDGWRGLSCTLGRRVKVVSVAGSVEGVAKDVDETGTLLLEKKDGSVEKVNCGDVVYV